jgi:tetratricopeptide (TPR) repeat protein
MPDLSEFEQLREAGDYDALRRLLPDDLETWNPFDEKTILTRIVAADVYVHDGNLIEMEQMIAPYITNTDIKRVPLSVVARVFLMNALSLHYRNKSDQAIQMLGRAQTIAAATDDEKLITETVHCEGDILYSLAALEKAIQKFEAVLVPYAAQGRIYRIGLASLGLGRCLTRLGRLQQAAFAIENAIRILARSRDVLGLALATESLAYVLSAQEAHPSALRLHRCACETFQRLGSNHRSLVSRTNIVEALLRMGQYVEAGAIITEVVSLQTSYPTETTPQLYRAQATFNALTGRWEQAERAARLAVEIAERSEDLVARAEARMTLGNLYLVQWRDIEAASELRAALLDALKARDTLLELEIKAMLAGALHWLNFAESGRLMSEVESEIKGRQFPHIQQTCRRVRSLVAARASESLFILSDEESPALNDARSRLVIWLLERALRKTGGNLKQAGSLLKVTGEYVRKLLKRLNNGHAQLFQRSISNDVPTERDSQGASDDNP